MKYCFLVLYLHEWLCCQDWVLSILLLGSFTFTFTSKLIQTSLIASNRNKMVFYCHGDQTMDRLSRDVVWSPSLEILNTNNYLCTTMWPPWVFSPQDEQRISTEYLDRFSGKSKYKRISMSLLYWGVQNWTQKSRCDLTWRGERLPSPAYWQYFAQCSPG